MTVQVQFICGIGQLDGGKTGDELIFCLIKNASFTRIDGLGGCFRYQHADEKTQNESLHFAHSRFGQ